MNKTILFSVSTLLMVLMIASFASAAQYGVTASQAGALVSVRVEGQEQFMENIRVPQELSQTRIMIGADVDNDKIERNMKRFMEQNTYRCEAQCEMKIEDAAGEHVRVMTKTASKFLIFSGTAEDQFLVDEEGVIKNRTKNFFQFMLDLGFARVEA